jgi:hypothetical protein
VQENLDIATIIQMLTNTLDVLCADECNNLDAYNVKQKIVNKISSLIDKINAD